MNQKTDLNYKLLADKDENMLMVKSILDIIPDGKLAKDAKIKKQVQRKAKEYGLTATEFIEVYSDLNANELKTKYIKVEGDFLYILVLQIIGFAYYAQGLSLSFNELLFVYKLNSRYCSTLKIVAEYYNYNLAKCLAAFENEIQNEELRIIYTLYIRSVEKYVMEVIANESK